MAEPTPADELRQAAAKLRGPAWRGVEDLAEPLADLLDQLAALADLNEYQPPRRRYDLTKALAVARAINASRERT